MSSNLKVNTILPSAGSNIGIGTNGGELNIDGGCKVQVGTALTLGHSIGLQYATQNLHSAGFEINQINASGIITASSYRGDGSQLTGITGTTINNNADNRIITGSGTANTLNGEANFTFDGNTLNISGSSNDARVSILGHEGYDARLSLIADQGDDHIDQWNIRSKASNNTLTIDQFGGGTFNTRLTIASDANSGDVTVNTGDLIIGTSGKGVDFPNSSLFESSVNMHLDIASGNNDFYIRSGGTTFAAFKGQSKDLQLTSGNLVIATSGKGIQFPNHTNTSASGTGNQDNDQLLADYEFGTWTPYDDTGTSMSGASGIYMKMGHLVYVAADMTFGNRSGGQTVVLNGLPFAIGGGAFGGGYLKYTNISPIGDILIHLNPASSSLHFPGLTRSESSGKRLDWATLYVTYTY